MNHDIEHALAAAQENLQAGRLDDAAGLLRGILASVPDHGEALSGLGYIAANQGDHARAAEYLVQASAHVSMSMDQLNFAAQVCQLAQRHDAAIALFERCLTQFPHHAASLYGVAMSLIQLGELQRALEALVHLCKIQPQSAEAHYNRGTLLGTMARYEDELDAYQQAITLKPRFVRAYVNLGVALRDLGRFDEALLQFKKALSIDPNDAGARTNRAQTNLLLGEFEHGWREYEWRWRDGTCSHGFPQNTLWTGTQPIDGKTVLVHHEQGFGDTLQFVRFVDRLSAAGAHVVLRVQDALLPLLQNYRGAAEVIGERSQVPHFDYHIPTLSLPFALKVRAPDLALSGPYVQADGALAPQWDDLFTGSVRRPSVGIVWSGSRTHLNDHNRSISLEQLKPVFDANADFFALQPDVRDSDRACLAQLEQRGVLRDVSGRLTTFAETAALIARLDLVISVDTAVAHLAGALGKPVWIALPFMPDWRWQLDRSDSPWYAKARLFRQTTRDDWTGVVAALRAEIDALPGPDNGEYLPSIEGPV
ncbi:tetratricopeptide repeat protein [Paraburkholderia aspalathi]|uniref:Tetratricopeptide (TPR) repeat n=1 Tax=Paraburkholderia aspalathi TaxID=1324617 RepID=A0A1I7EPV9_9BURK|nr:tetratricopeptide repeat protein [Paraburkholderia aspalathi]SFU25959.1 Tetratricopeptide (TPR) repeat [Paraburkholderia aspalathi]